jgi:hypothetical protein
VGVVLVVAAPAVRLVVGVEVAAADVVAADVVALARGVAVAVAVADAVAARLAWPLGVDVGVLAVVVAGAPAVSGPPAAAAASAVMEFGSAPFGVAVGVAVGLAVDAAPLDEAGGGAGGAVAIAALGVPATVTVPSGATTSRAESCTDTMPSSDARWASAGAASIAVTSRRSCSLCSLSARAAERASCSR